jgi:predicted phage terminase large subunit-like protein
MSPRPVPPGGPTLPTTSSTSTNDGKSPTILPLSDAELLALSDDIDRLALLESPLDSAQIVTRHDSEPWLPYRHLVALNTELMRLMDGEIDRLMITMPPRHGKSLLCSLHLPAWFLNKYPDKRIILCSYGDDYASEWGRKVRDLIRDHNDKFTIRVNEASKAADRWDVAGHRGGMKTAGVGGPITGRGAHLLIIDDPVKNNEEANSAVDRDKKWDWWRTTAQSRLEPGGVVIVIQTRWHEDDLAGRLLREEGVAADGGRWTLLNLPAIAEDNDQIGRVPGEALCPERYDEAYFALLTGPSGIGNQAFSALYQQRPQPEGGGAFKRQDFRYYTAPPSDEKTYALHDPDGTLLVPVSECWRFITMDLALTTRQTSDYTVAAVWDVAPWLAPSRLILTHIERTRIEGAEHLDMVKRLWQQWRPSFIGIEEAMQGSMTLAVSQRQGIIVRPLKHKSKDKAFRAKDAELLVENHRVYFPKRASWLNDFEHELLIFPTGTHDDQVDAFAYAAQQVLRGLNMAKKKPDVRLPSIEEQCWSQVSRKGKVTEHPTLGAIW